LAGARLHARFQFGVQAEGLFKEAGILDGGGGIRGEHFQQRFIFRLVGIGLITLH